MALGKGLDVLRPLTLAARVIGRPTIMTGLGRHRVLAAPHTRAPRIIASIAAAQARERGFLPLPAAHAATLGYR